MRANADAFGDVGGLRNHRRRMDAGGQFGNAMPVEPLRQQCVHQVGLAAENRDEGNVLVSQGCFPDRRRHNHRRRAAAFKLSLQLGVGQEADLLRTGTGK